MTACSRRAILANAALAALGGRSATAHQEEIDGIVRPSALGPSIPPELFVLGGNWPVAQGDLGANRRASGSGIDSTSLGSLDTIWTFEVEASTGYGGMTA